MKRIFLVVVLLATSIAVFAQQTQRISTRPTSDQTKENARKYLEQSKSNASQFDLTQSTLITRNVNNDDARNFNILRAEIERLEVAIVTEQNKIAITLEKGLKVSKETLDNVQKLLDKYKEKLAELEAFTLK
jgi:hypothetical protein